MKQHYVLARRNHVRLVAGDIDKLVVESIVDVLVDRRVIDPARVWEILLYLFLQPCIGIAEITRMHHEVKVIQLLRNRLNGRVLPRLKWVCGTNAGGG